MTAEQVLIDLDCFNMLAMSDYNVGVVLRFYSQQRDSKRFYKVIKEIKSLSLYKNDTHLINYTYASHTVFANKNDNSKLGNIRIPRISEQAVIELDLLNFNEMSTYNILWLLNFYIEERDFNRFEKVFNETMHNFTIKQIKHLIVVTIVKTIGDLYPFVELMLRVDGVSANSEPDGTYAGILRSSIQMRNKVPLVKLLIDHSNKQTITDAIQYLYVDKYYDAIMVNEIIDYARKKLQS